MCVGTHINNEQIKMQYMTLSTVAVAMYSTSVCDLHA